VIKRRRREADFCYPAEQVWAAACAAFRINGAYRKYPDIQDGKIVAPANRELVKLYLGIDNCEFVTEADRRQAAVCQQTLKNSVTMQALKGELDEWSLLIATMTALEEVTTDYEISVITALPKNYHQIVDRENINSRLAHCDATLLGRVNDIVTLEGEIVRVNYSNRFNTFYTTVITAANQEVFFAYRERLATTRRIRFCGRIKRHAGRATQLSRVRILEQEVV
jgi:hypothetical protein